MPVFIKAAELNPFLKLGQAADPTDARPSPGQTQEPGLGLYPEGNKNLTVCFLQGDSVPRSPGGPARFASGAGDGSQEDAQVGTARSAQRKQGPRRVSLA